MQTPPKTPTPNAAASILSSSRSLAGGTASYSLPDSQIDTEFVAQIGTADGEKLALALLDIARVFGAAIVAEGVETEGQRAFLRNAGCGF